MNAMRVLILDAPLEFDASSDVSAEATANLTDKPQAVPHGRGGRMKCFEDIRSVFARFHRDCSSQRRIPWPRSRSGVFGGWPACLDDASPDLGMDLMGFLRWLLRSRRGP